MKNECLLSCNGLYSSSSTTGITLLVKRGGICSIFVSPDLPIQSDLSGPSLQYRRSLQQLTINRVQLHLKVGTKQRESFNLVPHSAAAHRLLCGRFVPVLLLFM